MMAVNAVPVQVPLLLLALPLHTIFFCLLPLLPGINGCKKTAETGNSGSNTASFVLHGCCAGSQKQDYVDKQ